MAGGHAAASVSLTIGVAVATLLVVGGILAGPAILDCAKQTGGIGACLREKVTHSSSLPAPPAAPIETAVSSEPPSAAPPIVADIPRNTGWIEVNATEYDPRPSAVAILSPAPGNLDASGLVPSNPASAADALLTRPPGQLTASLSEPASIPTPSANLVARTGEVRADGGTAVPAALGSSRLIRPIGKLTASFSAIVLGEPSSANLLPTPSATGGIGTNLADPAIVTLEAKVVPDLPLPLPRPVIASPVKSDATPEKLEASASAVPAAKPLPTALPVHVVKADPRYPNVLVLPPPNSGADSSFATLTLHSP